MVCQRACQSAAFPAIEEKLCHNTRLVLEEAATKGSNVPKGVSP
ncbi:MAG: hypothetical protein WBE22_09915 [Halobacteriota archaeon]